MRIGSWIAAIALAGCGLKGSPTMDPGEDCLECHGAGGDHEARRWTLAGTVFGAPDAPASAGLRGVSVHATDAEGRTVTIRSNQAGNFYLADQLAFPLRVSIEQDGVVKTMAPLVTYGGCNHCHRQPPANGAPGRLSLP
jgi:hypothetical protein